MGVRRVVNWAGRWGCGGDGIISAPPLGGLWVLRQVYRCLRFNSKHLSCYTDVYTRCRYIIFCCTLLPHIIVASLWSFYLAFASSLFYILSVGFWLQPNVPRSGCDKITPLTVFQALQENYPSVKVRCHALCMWVVHWWQLFRFFNGTHPPLYIVDQLASCDGTYSKTLPRAGY